jgi:hypothetical protein
MADQQALQPLGLPIQGRKLHQFTLDFFKLGKRVKHEAFIQTDGNHQLAIAVFMQLRPITGGHGQSTLFVEIDRANASKQEIPLLPLGSIFFHLLPLKRNIEIIRNQVKRDPDYFFGAMALPKQASTKPFRQNFFNFKSIISYPESNRTEHPESTARSVR